MTATALFVSTRGQAPAAGFSAAMNRGELADGVVVANLERRGLTVKFQIRRRASDRGERKNSIALTDGSERLDDDARADHRTRADLHLGSNHRAGSDLDARIELGPLVDDRGGMDSAGYRTCSSTSIADNSASAASSSPTRATACIRHSGR